ncbi:hypothetical protein Aple_011210 [Acrocarpospora pleiomorpha]|uniref:Uncharacterized protein n=1 Tax=Acrocarpospora pleiomorpha TaxID=90975 RepID=A0A5M3XC32_9ACTN|nr:hypothetical protein [Acrocarpospora pleiomorpha]GES18226.1 hypothetical protein Aple_011210 [Acrocarpospora pleiomorpha]
MIIAAAAMAPVLALTGTALADPVAPYAQAVVRVTKTGAVVSSKGVIKVTRVNVGKYCIYLDRRISAARSVPIATLQAGADRGSEIYASTDSIYCGAGSNTVLVYTGTNGQAANQPFFVQVP